MGDPYFAVELARPGSIASFETGVRVPLMTDESGAVFPAFFTDLDRYEAFGRRILSVWGIAQLRSAPSASGVRTSARLGFVHRRFVGEDAGADPTNNNMVYALMLGGQFQPVWLDLGVSGRLIMSELDEGLGRATIKQLGASARVQLGKLMPGVQFRMPLEDELRGEIFSLGLSLEWQY
ncbi:MAG: hypothetical protein ACREMA_13335 [Longimicrobiales bacterium]